MHLDEVAFVIIAKSRARGAVGFIAEDQIERWKSVFFLRLADGVDGMVGAEYNAHMRVTLTHLHFFCQLCWVSRGGVA